jgi:GxxExxY protein
MRRKVWILLLNLLHQELTYKINGAGMYVHKKLRHGLREEVYQNAMEQRLAELGISFVREYQTDVRFDGEVVGIYYLDFFIEGAVVLELKAVTHPPGNLELAQCLRYMQVTGAPVGLLHNFGRPSFEWKRYLPPKTWGPYRPEDDLWLRRGLQMVM